jgi:hypothetical protein
MFNKAISIFNGRPEYAAQIARTLYHLSQAQAQLNLEEDAARTSRECKQWLEKLTKKHRRKITYDELKELIRNNWD